MTQMKCGNCRFFQDAEVAGSGWCHHPQRTTSVGDMVLVRRNELACRDEWGLTLWQSSMAPLAVTPVRKANKSSGDTSSSWSIPSAVQTVPDMPQRLTLAQRVKRPGA